MTGNIKATIWQDVSEQGPFFETMTQPDWSSEQCIDVRLGTVFGVGCSLQQKTDALCYLEIISRCNLDANRKFFNDWCLAAKHKDQGMKLTRSAVEQLKALIREHPEDSIVRVQVRDLDEQRLSFSITLEDRVQPDDEVQRVDGVTVAIPTAKAVRMQDILMDYHEPDGFKFHHSDQPHDPRLNVISLN